MKIQSLGHNQTVVYLNDDTSVFFSYETPVAAIIGDNAYKTAEKWSVTTSKHINGWLKDYVDIEVKPQDFFDRLAE